MMRTTRRSSLPCLVALLSWQAGHADVEPLQAGPLETNKTWSGKVRVGGDVTIESGPTLAKGTRVLFVSNRDVGDGGKDKGGAGLIAADSARSRPVLRIVRKVSTGALAAVGVGYLFRGEPYTAPLFSFGIAYPLGVYLADARETSPWMIFTGAYLGWQASKIHGEISNWPNVALFLAGPVLASELSRLVPKRFHNPLRWILRR